MRVLHYKESSFQLVEINPEQQPYAILSHTWGDAKDEVTYKDITRSTGHHKKGFEKLKFCRDQAGRDGYEYFWIDTCCINKKDDAELTAAIRSMYRWYKHAEVCYVYLSDVSMNKRGADGQPRWEESFKACRWFTRGWTLQELVASRRIEFFARDGGRLGDKVSLCHMIRDITGIHEQAINGSPQAFSHLTRFSWAANRQTQRPEDMAYCLAGICGVQVSAKYGEGESEARMRLEDKIRRLFGSIALEHSQSLEKHISGTETNNQQSLPNRKAIFDALRFDAMGSRRDTIKMASSETCRWILSHPAYEAWKVEQALREHFGFFWIKGKPGAGKSVLIKFLDQHISKSLSKTDVHLSFYFNARGEGLEKSFLGLYRSLLVQLLNAVPELDQVFLDGLPSGGLHDGSDESIRKLQNALREVVDQLTERRVYCFVDALDECEENDIERMIDYFRDLQQRALERGNSFYVCFASRHYPIYDIPTGLQLVLEDVNEHQDDLTKYIDNNLRRTTRKQLEKIKQDIITKANGVFLWVVIVVEILKKEIKNGRIHDIAKRLEELPPGLTQLFASILQRDRENMRESILCLRWIAFASRPLQLPEFYFAMMAGISPSHTQVWSPDDISDDQMHSLLLSSSKGLAELTRGKRTVQFIHESVREFLRTEEGLQYIQHEQSPSPAHIHEALKHFCLRGMEIEDQSLRQAIDQWRERWSLPRSGNTQREAAATKEERADAAKVLQRQPFLFYATTAVLYHSDQAAAQVPQLEFLKKFELSDWLDKANLIIQQRINLYKRPLDLIYLCAERDLANLITELHKAGHSLTLESPQRNGTPLFAAFANQSKNAARVLLQLGGATNADEIVNDVIVENYKGRAAYDAQARRHVALALEQGHDSLANHLVSAIEPGAVTTTREGKYMLLAAAKHGHLGVVTQLLSRGADVNARIGEISVLYAACNAGQADVVGLLLEHGANINAVEDSHSHALQSASGGGHVGIVKLLLDNGAEIDAIGGYRPGNALEAASRGGHEDLVRMLLKRGAKTLVEEYRRASWFGSNALREASKYRRLEVVKLLLDRGADMNAKVYDISAGTALLAASQAGLVDVVELLLSRGADLSARDGGWDAFDTALN